AYAEAQRAIADRREGLARLNGQVNSLKSRLGASAEEIGRLERRRTDALSRAEQADNEFKTHEATLSGLNDSESDLDANYEKAVTKVSVLKEQHSQLKTAEAQANQKQAALTARVDALRLGLERKDASEAILASGRKGIFGRLSDKLSVTKGWEPALSAALGMAAEALVVDSKQNALDILNELKTSDDGRTQFVLADAVEATKNWPALKNHRYLIELVKLPTEYKTALTQLLGGVVAVDDLDQAAQVLAEYPTLSAVTADGMFFTPALAVGGSSAKPTLIEVQAAMEQAENELATALQTAKKFHDELVSVGASLDQAKAAEKAALAQLHESDAKLAGLSDQLAKFRQTSATAEHEAERLAEAISQAEKNREKDLASLAELENRLEVASSDEDIAEPDPTERDE
ncbi:MAG: chromosome segregation protein SMC, partial [Actinomycetales bacterium]